MSFVVKDENGKISKRKTAVLEKRLEKACKKIVKTVFEEVTSFTDEVERAGATDDRFRRAAAHRAMLILHRENMDVFLSAEFGDLFASADLKSPTSINTWVDVERLENAREKWETKQAGKTK
jgi:hypothetical protein